jgi:RHS repeat-associated protein
MDYDEWGVVTTDTSPGFQPFGFAGGLYDLSIGFARLGFRDYLATRGRWVSKDQAGPRKNVQNMFEYSNSDPSNREDVDGLDAIIVTGGPSGTATYFAGSGPPTWIPLATSSFHSGLPGVSDPTTYGAGPTPPGLYKIEEPPGIVPASNKRQGSFCDKSGNCWFVPYKPQFQTPNQRCPDLPPGRCGMHPSQHRGTQGCTGLEEPDTSDFLDAINNYNPSPSNPLPVLVLTPPPGVTP